MCRRIALTLVVIIVLGLGGAAWLATRHESAVTTSVPSPKSASPQQVHDAEQRLRAELTPMSAPSLPDPAPPKTTTPDPAASSPATTPPPPDTDVTVRINQDDLNTLLAGDPRIHARLSASGVRSVRIALAAPDQIAAVARIDYQGHNADVTANGAVSVTDQGTLAFTTHSLTIGLLPLPSAVSDKVQAQIDAALGQVQASLPLRVTRLRVEDKQILLSGPRKPDGIPEKP